MINIYKTNLDTGKLQEIESPTKGCWINLIKPSEKEIKDLARMVEIDEELIKYPLDISEKAHIDSEDTEILIVVDAPVTEIDGDKKIYTTMPLGMIIVRDDIFLTISQSRLDVIENILNNRKANIIQTEKKSRFVFQILYKIAQDYIKYLTYINNDINTFEKQMERTINNKELLKILNFEKSMIYFNASLKANQVVLEKLKRGKSIKLYEEDEEILEDTLIENRQAIEMIQTYSEILNGIIDIFGTMVSNNLNSVMKVLTSITVIISLPTMVSSFLGMNVDFPFNTTTIGFYAIIFISFIVSVVATLFLKKRNML